MSTTIINRQTELGGAIYPFLERLNKPWVIASWDVDGEIPTFNGEPTLRWVNGDQVKDLYIQDCDTTTFCKETGLQLFLNKGGYVLSKRISRIMRSYFISGFFSKSEIQVRYLDLDEREKKVWDGAGQVSRSLLLSLIEQLPANLPEHKRRELERELRHTKRIEFTLMGIGSDQQGGQDKGHAIVIEDLDVDFVLPEDTKNQVQLKGDQVWIGLYPVHAQDDIRLDIQSLINLYPFFEPSKLTQWLEQDGELFFHGIQSGEVSYLMSGADSLEDQDSLEPLNKWYLREYFLSGGDPMWFGSIVKALINQHLKRLNYNTLAKMRLPIPGGRYYVMTDTVGNLMVPRGKIRLDRQSGTAWVNHEDWCDYEASIWGGADQDDALWLFPFEDWDSENKILAWRSPNQCGEYVILKPTEDSHIPQWDTLEGSIRFSPMDSRKLPKRADSIQTEYLNLVDPEASGGLGEWLETYTIDAMQYTIDRAISNKAILGQYCNTLMLAKAVYDQLPKHPPGPLEMVIDATVKTGSDISRVGEWCYQACNAMLQQKKPIPQILHNRLSMDPKTHPSYTVPVASTDHWLDQLVAAIEAHIVSVETERNQLMAITMPPVEIFASAFTEQSLEVGARFNQIYTSKLPWAQRTEERLEIARQATESYLKGQDRYRVLRGAIAHYYINPEHKGMDEAVWQLGPKTESGREAGIAQDTIIALREIGVLDELALIDGVIKTYPGAKILDVPYTLIIAGVWFNWLRSQNPNTPDNLRDVPKAEADAAKRAVQQLAKTSWRNMTLLVQAYENRKVTYTEDGRLFGYVKRQYEDRVVVGRELHVIAGIIKDGNMICFCKYQYPELEESLF